MDPKALEPLWNVRDLATYVKTTPDAIYKWVEQAQVPFIRLGRSIRFDLAAIREWLRSHHVGPKSVESGPRGR